MVCFKRFSDAAKSCNTKKKKDELKLRVVLRKEGEIGQAGRIKGLMRASGDLQGQSIFRQTKNTRFKK